MSKYGKYGYPATQRKITEVVAQLHNIAGKVEEVDPDLGKKLENLINTELEPLGYSEAEKDDMIKKEKADGVWQEILAGASGLLKKDDSLSRSGAIEEFLDTEKGRKLYQKFDAVRGG